MEGRLIAPGEDEPVRERKIRQGSLVSGLVLKAGSFLKQASFNGLFLVCSQERRRPAARESDRHRVRDASGKMAVWSLLAPALTRFPSPGRAAYDDFLQKEAINAAE